jgi:hypothetical protein
MTKLPLLNDFQLIFIKKALYFFYKNWIGNKSKKVGGKTYLKTAPLYVKGTSGFNLFCKGKKAPETGMIILTCI